MAAHEWISEDQFLPVTQLREAVAGDYEKGVKVGDLHRGSADAHDAQNYDWEGLHRDMAKEGMRRPLLMHQHEGNWVLNNGHHRAVVAMDQGMMFVPIRQDEGEGASEWKSKYNRWGGSGAS